MDGQDSDSSLSETLIEMRAPNPGVDCLVLAFP